MSPEEALQRFRSDGDDKSFALLFGRCRGKCAHRAKKYLDSEDDVNDALQAAQTQLVKKHDEIETLSHFEALAMINTKRAAIDRMNYLDRFGAELPDNETAGENEMEAALYQQQLEGFLRRCLERLADHYRAVLLLVFVEALSAPQAAVVLGEEPTKVRSHRDNGIRRLRECMERRIGTRRIGLEDSDASELR